MFYIYPHDESKQRKGHRYILLRLNPFGLSVDREGWWFEHSMSQLRVCLSAEGAKNVSQPWLSPLRGWGSLNMTSTGKFVYIYIYIHTYIHRNMLYIYIIYICTYIYYIYILYIYIYYIYKWILTILTKHMQNINAERD